MGMFQSKRLGDWKVMDQRSFKNRGAGAWTPIGAGGFGQVYKARHRGWKKDVAVKSIGYLSDHSEQELLHEADLMQTAAKGPYIMQVLGVFVGCTPFAPTIQVCLVMDLMERGSLDFLQKKRKCQPLPWPLVFRLVHQVAEGMKYLHSLTPDALIHKDLKPQNILLDSDLNVKITDFGLAKFDNTATAAPLKGFKTEFFAPPEAFNQPGEVSHGGATCAFDVYSYAILLWTILNPAYVIARGDVSHSVRPSLEAVNRMEVPGLEQLVQLMVTCWHQSPKKRPTFAECTAVTERQYDENKHGINYSVSQVKEEQDGVVIRKYPKRECTAVTERQYDENKHGINYSVSQVKEEQDGVVILKEPKRECTAVTERQYDENKHGINYSVSQVKEEQDGVVILKEPKRECTAVTERQYDENKHGINYSVSQVKEEQDGVVILKEPKRDFQRLTLDTNTTHRKLSLSENNRKVTVGHQVHSYPDHHERFEAWEQVLCSESLTGRCYWEVEWSGDVGIAVTYRGISRKGYVGDCCLGDNDKSWNLYCNGCYSYSYWVRHNSELTLLPVRSSVNRLDEEGRRVYRAAVYLDHPAGTLSFYEVSSDTLTHLYTFQTSFTEPLYAGFWVWYGGSVRLCDQR